MEPIEQTRATIKQTIETYRTNETYKTTNGSLPNPHTPSIAFRHLPPNSARFSYATEGALFISAQLSTDAISALRKVRVLIRLWKQPSAQARM